MLHQLTTCRNPQYPYHTLDILGHGRCDMCGAKADLDFPPQGEPGGDPEEPLTEKEADEQEKSSHTHP